MTKDATDKATALAALATDTATKLATTVADTATKLAVTNAVLATNVEEIKGDISEIKQTLKELNGVFVTQIKADETEKLFDIRVVRLENSSNLWKWLSPTLAAASAFIVEFLFTNYLQHLR